MAESRDVVGVEVPVAESIEVPEDPRRAEQEPGADKGAVVDVAEAVTPSRRFYANPADL